MHIIPQPARKVKMQKLEVKRSSFLIEPANRRTGTPRTDTKSTVLETIGEIVSLIAILIVGWIAWIVL